MAIIGEERLVDRSELTLHACDVRRELFVVCVVFHAHILSYTPGGMQ